MNISSTPTISPRFILTVQISLTGIALLFSILTLASSTLHLGVTDTWWLRIYALVLNVLALLLPHYVPELAYAKLAIVSGKIKAMWHVAVAFPIVVVTVNFLGLACEVQRARDHCP